MKNAWTDEIDRLRKVNRGLLGALKYWFDSKADPKTLAEMARAAIEAAERGAK